MPDNMQTITASKEKIPQFIPLAIGESDAPKQAAQAMADGVDAATIATVRRNTKTDLARVIGN